MSFRWPLPWHEWYWRIIRRNLSVSSNKLISTWTCNAILSATQVMFGVFSTKIVYTAPSGGFTIFNSSTTIIPITPNTTYTLSVYIFLEAGTVPSIQMAASDYISNQMTWANGANTLGVWQRLYATYTTATGQTTIQCWGNVPIGNTFYIDGILVEQSSVLGNWFDKVSY